MGITDFTCDLFKVEVVEDGILLVTLTRPKALNSVPGKYHMQFFDLWAAYETDESLVCAILTGTGKVFSAGADLKDWLSKAQQGDGAQAPTEMKGGFMGLSNRSPRKPVIAALNGPAYGGGTEVVTNCDLAVASANATLALPEVRRGVTALAGALPRISRQYGLKRATELALIGEPITAQQAHSWGMINKVVESPQDVVPAAVEMARKIKLGSPEAVQASLISLRRGFEQTSLTPEEATEQGANHELAKVTEMPNISEGLLSFNEKRQPKWHKTNLSSKL